MIKKIIYTFTSRIGIAIINLVIAVILSRWLGAELKGVQSLLLIYISLITTITGFAGISSLSYLLPKSPKANYLIASTIWSFTICTIIYLLSTTLHLIPTQYIFSIIAISLVSSLGNNNLSILLYKEKIREYNRAMLLQPVILVLMIAAFFVVTRTLTISNYLVSLLISYILFLLISISGLKYLQKLNDSNSSKSIIYDLRQLLKYGFYNQTATIIQLASFRGAYFIIEKYCTTSEVGIYSNAVSITESIWLISRSISLVMYSKIINTESTIKQRKLIIRFSQITFYIQLPAILLISVIPAQFYVYIFGKDFYAMKTTIVFLLPGVLLYGQSLISGHYFSGTGNHKINTLSNLGGMIVLLISSFFLIPHLALVGAAISTFLGYFTLLLIQSYYLKKKLQIGFVNFIGSRNKIVTYHHFLKKMYFKINKRKL